MMTIELILYISNSAIAPESRLNQSVYSMSFMHVLGLGVELFLRSYKMYAVFFVVLTLVSIYPVVDNARGNRLSETDSYWILKYCLGNQEVNGSINYFGFEWSNMQMQVYTQWLVVVLWMAFISYKSKLQNDCATKYDSAHDTASDYALMISNLPPETTISDIIAHFEKPEFSLAVRGSEGEPLRLVKECCVVSYDVRDMVLAHREWQEVMDDIRTENVILQALKTKRESLEISVGEEIHSPTPLRKVEKAERNNEAYMQDLENKRQELEDIMSRMELDEKEANQFSTLRI